MSWGICSEKWNGKTFVWSPIDFIIIFYVVVFSILGIHYPWFHGPEVRKENNPWVHDPEERKGKNPWFHGPEERREKSWFHDPKEIKKGWFHDLKEREETIHDFMILKRERKTSMISWSWG